MTGLPLTFFLELWNYSTDPWTDLFKHFFGHGEIFYIIPVIVLTVGLYIKTNNITVPSMFMIGSGVLLGVTTLIMGMPILGLIFIIFGAIGIGSLFINLIYGG